MAWSCTTSHFGKHASNFCIAAFRPGFTATDEIRSRESFVMTIGRHIWAIPEGYIPGQSHGPAPEMTSHEACCLLNASEKKAHIVITLFFEDQDPVGPYQFEIAPRRTRHLRFNNFDNPKKIPLDTPYSSLIESDTPIVV